MPQLEVFVCEGTKGRAAHVSPQRADAGMGRKGMSTHPGMWAHISSGRRSHLAV